MGSKALAVALLLQENAQWANLSDDRLFGRPQEIRLRREYELRIAELTHFRKIESGDFGFDGNALS
jgi:hypothetical protein